MTDYAYLNSLIEDVNELRKQINFHEIDIKRCDISYMPTKKTSFVGYKQGYSDYLIQRKKEMKESDRLRSTTKDYLRFIKNKDGELIQIEYYNKGKLDCLFQVYWFETIRYLFPFSSNGGFYPTYSFATKYEANSVVEEYMVEAKQIIYEAYSYISDERIDYSYINYVRGGNYPIREIKRGKFSLNPLSYEESNYDNWLEHR